MMKRAFFLFFCFSVLSVFADGQSDFNSLKNRIQQELVTADGYVLNVESELSDAYDQFSQLTYPGTSDYAYGYNAALSDVSRTVMQDVRNAQQYCTAIHSQITATQALVSQLQYGSASNIDYTVILSRMTNQLNQIDIHLQTNTFVISECINVSNQILDAILSALGDLGGSSGGEVDSTDYTEQLSDIISHLQAIRNYLQSLDSNVSSLVSFFTSQNGIFRTYLKLVEDRLKSPDVNLSSDLSRMWEYTLMQMTNVVYHPSQYTFSSQINPVLNNVGENDTRLSNEGLIQLENLAVNQRQYLCSVEALSLLQQMTNNNDVAWITNYLASVQAGYYQSFNRLFAPVSSQAESPFIVGHYNDITNFLASKNTSQRYLNYRKVQMAHSNVFQRIEIALWALNGMYGKDDLSNQETDDLLDGENFERRADYMTNAVSEAISDIGAVSNNLVQVVNGFKSLVDSFDLESQQTTASPITLIPEYELGGVEISHVHFQPSDYESIQDFARIAFTCIYYLVFAVIFFHMFLFAIKVFTKSVAFVASTVSKLLS